MNGGSGESTTKDVVTCEKKNRKTGEVVQLKQTTSRKIHKMK